MIIVLPETCYAQEPGNDTLSITIPTADTLSAPKGALEAEVRYDARDSIRFDVLTQKVYLFGKASIEYEDIKLKADYIEIDWNIRELKASGLPDSSGTIKGTPLFNQGGQEFAASEIRYNFDSKRGKIIQVNTKEGEGYILGKSVKKEANDDFYIRHGAYTTCNLPHPHYYIGTGKLKVVKNKKIVTGPAYLVIADVPTPLVLPFGMFPNKKGRSSGILFPAYGESSNLGFFLRDGGYYLGISDHLDLALRGDIYSLGSYGLKAASAYKVRYKYSGQVQLNYSDTRFGEKELADYSRNKDFFIRWNHSQDPKARPGTMLTANVNAGSSTYYQNTISSGNDYLTNTFQSAVSWSKSWQGKPYNLSSNIRHSQNSLTKDVSLSLPDVTFSVNRFNPLKSKDPIKQDNWYSRIGMSYLFNARNDIETKDSLLFRKESLQNFRNGVRHNIPISTSLKMFKFLSLSPSANYSERWYLSTINKTWNAESNSIITDTIKGFRSARDFNLSANLNTRVYGMFRFKNMPVTAIRHVISPTVGFSYRPDFSDAFWNSYGQVQIDSLGNTSTYSFFEQGIFGGPGSGKSSLLNFNLDNNLEMKIRNRKAEDPTPKKVKIFESINLSGSYNLAADSLNWSLISLNGRTNIMEKLDISFSSAYDLYDLDSLGRRINTLLLDKGGDIARMTSGNISASMNLNRKARQSKPSLDPNTPEMEMIRSNPGSYVDFDVPWNLAVSFNLNYSKPGLTEGTVSKSVSTYGDLNLTPKWKIGFNSGYDFENKDFTYTSLNLYRDLHCWEMKFNWIPFGFHQSYNFQINVKSSVLQDLKLVRKRDWYDN